MNDLAEFLLARIAEDEADARAGVHIKPSGPDPSYVSLLDGLLRMQQRFDPVRVLAECEAKRRIVEDHAVYAKDMADAPSDFAAGRLFMARLALAQMALVHADHPAYRDEWRP